jgi:hypothetical protein
MWCFAGTSATAAQSRSNSPTNAGTRAEGGLTPDLLTPIIPTHRPIEILEFPVGEPGALGKTPWESTSETESAEGASSDTLNPATARLLRQRVLAPWEVI